MEERTPSLEEEDAVIKYVLYRPLPRPDTDIRKAARCILVFIASVLMFSAASYLLLRAFGVMERFSWWLYALAVFVLALILFARTALIGCIRLYQHYASEKTRRRCLFRPTCSEYAILAVKKYGVIIGGSKAAFRVLFRCRGNVYTIDYP